MRVLEIQQYMNYMEQITTATLEIKILKQKKVYQMKFI